MKTLWQSLLLALSFVFIFVWQQTPLSQYTIQTLLGLAVFYAIFTFRIKKGSFSLEIYNPLAVFALNSFLVLLVFATGVFSSPIFFLLYFLGFGAALAFKPITVFVFLVGLVTVFIQPALSDDVSSHILMLFSLVMLSLFALFFGKESLKNEK